MAPAVSVRGAGADVSKHVEVMDVEPAPPTASRQAGCLHESPWSYSRHDDRSDAIGRRVELQAQVLCGAVMRGL